MFHNLESDISTKGWILAMKAKEPLKKKHHHLLLKEFRSLSFSKIIPALCQLLSTVYLKYNNKNELSRMIDLSWIMGRDIDWIKTSGSWGYF